MMKWTSKDVLALMVGHGRSLDGSWDSGCVYGGHTEAALMLKIVKVAVKYLRRSGVKVITDADANNNRNMKSCVSWSNRTGCKIYMSVHCDYKLASAGVAPLFKTSADKALAVAVGKSIAKQMGMKWKGAFKRTDLYELNAPRTTSANCILETGAIKADLKYLKQYAKYGKALAKAICKYLGVTFRNHTTPYIIRVATNKIVKRMKELEFVYRKSYTKCATTWPGAKRKRTSNCSMAISYALQVAKVLPKGQFFWINGDNITCKGGLTLAKLKQIATITHPHKSPKNASLKKGDIVGYKNSPHTMEFAGWNKKGEPLWYSIGPNDIRCGKAHGKPSYNGKTIYTKIRFK